MKKIVMFISVIILVMIAEMQISDYMHQKKQTVPAMSDDVFSAITITAVGDCTFGTDTNWESEFSFNSEYKRQKNNPAYFLKNVKPYFENDDLTIVNFEGTLSENGTREEKEFAFRGNPEYAKILTESSVEAANIANNHSRDYGEISFSDTKTILSDNGILWFEGSHFGFKEVNGIKIGLIGTNALYSGMENVLVRRMDALKDHNPDLIIANFHWGEEGSDTPTDYQKKLARLAIDNGADLVIGHHPHILQGIEKYRGKYILYSLGNFCFGGNKNPVDKDTMIFKQDFVLKNGALTGEERAYVIPCSVSSVSERNNYQPTSLSGKAFLRVKEKIEKRSNAFHGIKEIEFIERTSK